MVVTSPPGNLATNQLATKQSHLSSWIKERGIHPFWWRVGWWRDWAIPENIRTVRRTAFWNSKGKGGSLNWNSEGKGGTYDWNSEGIGGFQIWDFQRVQTSDFVGFPFPIQGTSLNECC